MEVIRAPAKLNLWLKITGVRPDGYHTIDSLFVPVTLFDEIRARESARDLVVFKDDRGRALAIENDTVTRAVQIFRAEIRPTPGVEWEITKAIPASAGLGGGSSDGAAALKFLASRYAPDVDKTQLAAAALKLGADVPFFLESKPALVSGVGEGIRPISIEKLYFVIARLPFGVSTKEAYAWYDQENPKKQVRQENHDKRDCKLTQGGKLGTSGMINEVFEWQAKTEIIEKLRNDFEKVVSARHPEIDVMKKALRTWGALGSLMSGTGSSVYGVFGSLNEALAARESLQHSFPPPYAFFVCETLA